MNVPNPERRHVRRGKATVSWGPRHFGQPSIIATSPVGAINDLVEAVLQARAAIDPPEPLTYDNRPDDKLCTDCGVGLTWANRHQVVTPIGLVYVCPEHYQSRKRA